jgi:serine/threonine-protein kinase ULK/ATG1
MAELQGDYTSAEIGYENSLWLLQVLLDDTFYEGGVKMKDDDRLGVERCKCHRNPSGSESSL